MSSDVMTQPSPGAGPGRQGRTGWLWPAVSIVVLFALLWAFVSFDPLAALTGSMPPVEDISIQRTELGAYGIRLHVLNGSPQAVTIAQVLVDDAYWYFESVPAGSIPRLGSATLTIPYPWVEGEAHEIVLITDSGATFDAPVEVAVATPEASPASWWTLGLLGLFVGVVPVSLGLIWYPALRTLGQRGMNALLALTVGLLLYLLVDTMVESLEQAAALPGTLDGAPLVWLVALTSFLFLVSVSRRPKRVRAGEASGEGAPAGEALTGLRLAGFIALGIGLHNLGEGLAIGAAFNLGEAALGSFLVVGFTIHNLTEGIGICAPVVKTRPPFSTFVGLALLAGGPAIIGTWLGAFAPSPIMSTVFLAVGAGAIAQVVYEVARMIRSDAQKSGRPALSGATFAGLVSGFAVMYATALFVAL